MNWIESTNPEDEIKNVHCTNNHSEIRITWHWPGHIDFVYVHITPINQKVMNTSHKAKLFTREEYKVQQAYVERIEAIGKYSVRIYPCKKEDQLYAIKQVNEKNLAFFNTGRAKIYFSIHYRKRFFSGRKKVKMKIQSEIPLERTILCYVKKQGTVPVSVDDGTMYPFVSDFPSGETVLPEIEIAKDEYIRIFLQDGKRDADTYELIPS